MEIENIAFSSGGICGISYCGVIRALEELNISKNIKRISGSSAGAIIATLFSINYNSSEIAEIINQQDFGDLCDSSDFFSNVYRLIFNYGFYTCMGFYEWIGNLLQKKGYTENCTFKELFDRNNIELIITGTHLNQMKTIYFSASKSPNMAIRDALRISVSIPIYFEPVEKLNEYYVDGGMYCPCPINVFEEIDPYLEKTIAVYIINNIAYRKYHSINNILQFINIIFRGIMDYAEKYIYKDKYFDRTIFINPHDISFFDFSLSKENKKSLIRKGYRKTKNKLN